MNMHLFSRRLSTSASVRPVAIRNRDDANKALEVLYAHKERVHACDTEVCDIDLSRQGPVGNGRVTCASIYSGPDVDFGSGPGGTLWIDNLDEAEGTLSLFSGFLGDSKIKKVWHNYSFDRHVLYNHGINAKGLGGDTMHMARLWDSSRSRYSLEALSNDLLSNAYHKSSMKELFGVRSVRKDGSEGKAITIPPIETLQRLPETRTKFVEYSVLDSVATWELHLNLSKKLEETSWSQGQNMLDFYNRYLVPFAEMLTDMERRGIYVARDRYLPKLQATAEADFLQFDSNFRQWAKQYCDEADRMNLSSGTQKGTFFFGGGLKKNGERFPESRAFKVENTEGLIEEGKDKPKKYREMTIKGLGMTAPKYTATGQAATSAMVLQELAGARPSDTSDPVYGSAYKFFGGGQKGKDACVAIESLIKMAGVQTMVNTFIKPLQELADDDSRIHCSLNLNTETGRLSSRKPNLQNQPALEKDQYKIRDAFQAKKGHTFIVADYGQLELRVLAHVTNCTSMIEAFESGGDFHSRTALGMYDHIQTALAAGQVVLEEGAAGENNNAPLLKDVFASERRRAKVLNFSIAYGKTAFGLAKDWGVTRPEAQEEIDKWYKDRPEVLEWQKSTIEKAKETGYTRTLMGRYRRLPDLKSKVRSVRSHGERAAINTPIQGSAADVMMMGMLKIHRDEVLKNLGWNVLLQIHDEVIVEGPEGSKDEALARVVHCMQFPFAKPLRVDLSVDAKSERTWYRAK
jgi:DNA polymerase-1